MPDLTSVPDFDEITDFIKERVDAMRVPALQWADLARLAVQGLPYDAYRLTILEDRLNAIRAELRSVVLAASEHFTSEQLHTLRKQAGMSKAAWRAVKNKRTITIKHGFTLVVY
ncbi:MAG TPA: hypothetical protein VL461_05755 [Dictyobacter sp.]|jgi:hypothetical protein|nr:hypothetical protein [Dictyobacter sp.]